MQTRACPPQTRIAFVMFIPAAPGPAAADKSRLRPHQALSLASWAALNPGYVLTLSDDDDMRQLMVATAPPADVALYDGLASGVERSDMWRYQVTHARVHARVRERACSECVLGGLPRRAGRMG